MSGVFNQWIIVLVLNIIVSVSSLSAQQITGSIYDEESSSPVVQATVFLEGTRYGDLSDSTGGFILKDIEPGNYWLVVSTTGFETFYERVSIADKKSYAFEIRLKALDLYAPEIVVKAQSLTGGGAGLREIPGAAHYISPEELGKFQYTDIHRVLQRVPGVNIQEEDGFGLRPNIGLRGTGVERSSKVTIMEDGILMSPAPYSAPAAYYFPSIGRMQGVEVMKAGSQVRFGPFTTGGAINLISTSIPSETKASVRLQGGGFGYRQMYASAGGQIGQFGLLGEAFQFGSDGFKSLPAGEKTPIDRRDYLLKARWRSMPTNKIFQSVELKLAQATENSDETYLGLSSEDFHDSPFQRYSASQMDNITADHQQYALQYVVSDSRRMTFQTTLYRNDFYRNWYKSDYLLNAQSEKYSLVDILSDPVSNRRLLEVIRGASTLGQERVAVKANQREYYSQGVQSVINYRYTTGLWRHSIDLGYRYHEDAMDRYQWVDLYSMDSGQMKLEEKGRPGTESNRIESARAHAAYVQYKLESGRLTFIPGMRYEHILMTREDYGTSDPEREGSALAIRENTVGVWIPGLGIHYALSSATDIFGGVHRGFAPPGSKSGTDPEFSVNYEAGLRTEWPAGSLQFTGFYNDYKNLLGLDLLASGGGGTQDLFNGGEASIYGLEFMAEQNVSKLFGVNAISLPVFLNYTYTRGQFDHDFESDFEPWGVVESGDELPYLPRHQLSWGLGLDFRSLTVQLSSRWNDIMRTRAGQGDISDNEGIPSYHVMDVAVNWRTTQSLNLSFRVQNLLDETYLVSRRPAGLRPGLPRLLILGMQWEL